MPPKGKASQSPAPRFYQQKAIRLKCRPKESRHKTRLLKLSSLFFSLRGGRIFVKRVLFAMWYNISYMDGLGLEIRRINRLYV